MEPTINVGDLVFVVESQEIEKGDIISFRVSNSVVTHRVIDIEIDENNEKKYITKGDANSSQDIGAVKDIDIEGKYCFKIPKIGNVILFLKSSIGTVIVIFILSIFFFFTGNKKEEEKKEEDKKEEDKQNE